MILSWMGPYRNMVEKLIKYCNVYTRFCNKEIQHVPGISFSFAQIQVVEYLLENEDLNQNMKQIASRLGILPSAFSKLVNKLVNKKMLEKYHTTENKKEVIIRVTDFGRSVYEKYSDVILKNHFSKMFEVASKLNKNQIELVAKMLDAPYQKEASDKKKAELVKIV